VKKSELKAYKETLLALRARLRGDVNHLQEAALSKSGMNSGEVTTMPLHMADVGTDAFEQEFTLSLMENDEDTLAAIELALEKIEDGVYGTCEECEKVIAKSRLSAIPYAPLCIKCATQKEGAF
jgi:DnaK suppressor protein